MKKWQKILLGTVLVLGAGAWLWWQDEALNPQAQAWLEPPAESADSAAYFQLLGLDAPAGQEPQAVGRQLLQAHRQWRAQHDLSEPMAAIASERIELPGAQLCMLSEGDCVQRLREDRAVLAELLVRHGELLRRYETLLALQDYRSLSQPSMDEPLANFTTLDRANRLRAAQALALALDGRGDEALAALQQDVRLLRGWLARADNLILKMMLARQLGNDLDAIAALYRAGLVPAPAAQPALSEAERSLEAPMQREFALVGSGLLTLIGDSQAAAFDLGAGVGLGAGEAGVVALELLDLAAGGFVLLVEFAAGLLGGDDLVAQGAQLVAGGAERAGVVGEGLGGAGVVADALLLGLEVAQAVARFLHGA